MSLARLCRWHYWTLQTSSSPTVNADMSVDRDGSWSVQKLNLQGNIQRIVKDKPKNEYNIVEYKGDFVLYFINRDNLVVGNWNRIVFNLNPRKRLTQAIIDAHTKLVPTTIFCEFVGFGQQVEHPTLKYTTLVLRQLQHLVVA